MRYVSVLAVVLVFGILSDRACAAEGMSTAEGEVNVLLDNESLRVVEATRPPGTKVPMHTHPPYLAYFLGPWKVKFTSLAGKTAEKAFPAGKLICSPKGKQHAVEVLGTTDQLVLVIELKNQSEINCEDKGQEE